MDKNGETLHYGDIVYTDNPLYGELIARIRQLIDVNGTAIMSCTVVDGNDIFPNGTGVLLWGSDVVRLGTFSERSLAAVLSN